MGMSKAEKQAHYAKFAADEQAKRKGSAAEGEVAATPSVATPNAAESEIYKGTNGILVLESDRLIIRRGGRGFLTQGKLRGDKQIRYRDIVGIQFKKAGVSAGYIQFSTTGGHEASGGLMDAIKDENSVSFNSGKNTKRFEEAKDLIERRMDAVHGVGQATKTCPDCAETVLEAARVCKHCGYRFAGSPE